jgi:signal peptidase complex subunit 3
MHSTLVRAQNVFGFFTTVAFVIAALIAATDFIHPRTPSAKVSVDKVQVYVSLLLSLLPNEHL